MSGVQRVIGPWTIVLGALVAMGSFAQAGAPRILTWIESLKGTEDQEVRLPVGVAVASENELAVIDAHGSRLLRFRRIGVSWGLNQVVDLPGSPVGLTYDGSRYVASLRGVDSLVSFEGENLQQSRIPLPDGVVPGPVTVLGEGTLLLFDYAGSRFVQLGRRGELLGESEAPPGVSALAGMSTGGFLAAVPQEGALYRYGAGGRFEESWSLPGEDPIPAWPSGMVVEPGGDVVVVDRHGGRILLLDGLGELIGVGARKGSGAGLLLYPGGITLLPNGRLVVADMGNGRVQLFERSDRSAR